MTQVRRILAVSAVLALPAVYLGSSLWGDPAKPNDNKAFRLSASHPAAPKADHNFVDGLADIKFAHGGVVTYETADGARLFALQVKPDLPAAAVRPRDTLLLVDTSASKAMGPLDLAKKLTAALVEKAGPNDRFAVWTLNMTAKDLTRGFKSADAVQEAVKVLQQEYPAGAVNLKDGLSQAIKAFEGLPGRQQVVVYLGDGMSVAQEVTDKDRVDLSAEMVKGEIAFFPIPLGVRFDAKNLHGFSSATGGAVVRVGLSDGVEETVKKLNAAVSAPILYPKAFKLSGDVAEFFPTKLPPLRSDTPTLVVGRYQGAEEVRYTVEGAIAGQDVSVSEIEKVSSPEVDNFFLASMVKQWKEAKDLPALMRADRALAHAFQQNQLARDDLLAQAEWAMSEDKFDAAMQLFQRAKQLDPSDMEAKSGVDLVQKLRDGKLTRQQLRDLVKSKTVVHTVVAPDKKKGQERKVTRETIVLAMQQPGEPAIPPAPLAPAQAGDILKEARQRQQVEDQRNTELTNDAIRQATSLLREDPDRSHEMLKRTLDGIRNNPDISDKTKAALAARLETSLRSVDVQGARIKLDIGQRQELLARARERTIQDDAQRAMENQTVERVHVFHNLMEVGRFQEAAKQALFIAQDNAARGVPVPPAVTAGRLASNYAHNLREFEEVKRLSEERWMAAMATVERSHIPFPDEPPVEFPPAATWKRITDLRKEKYESSGMGEDAPRRTLQLRDLLTRPVNFGGFDDPKTTLQEAKEALEDRYGITVDVNETAFKAEMVNDVLSLPIAEKPIPKMREVTLATVIRKVLARIPVPSGATYIIRRDVIEITTGAFARAEKTVRVYPVADLVIPIPDAFDPQSLRQNASISGAGFSLFGSGPLGALGGIGGFGALGALGGIGGLGALGGIGGLGALGGIGGLGALGGAGGLGALGAGGGVGFGGGGAGFAGMGGNNLGVGGGPLGVGGGQLGQFGNLGGQFGLQGGNQSGLLIKLIQQVIGSPRDWAPLRGINLVGQKQPGQETDDTTGDPEGNDLGYYPPARALVVKGTSRIHTRVGSSLIAPPGAAGMGAADRNRGDRFARNDEPPLDPKRKNAVGGDVEKKNNVEKKANLKKDLVAKADIDPKTMWQEALARGVDDPGVIIACAEFLADFGKFEHAAEFLKADLRQGILVQPWVYDALAVALRECKASSEEIERAEASRADLEPLDAQGYLRAAQAMKDNNHYDRAIAFCKQAAQLEPNLAQAYANALVYAKNGQDREAMEWAAGNLLGREWPVQNKDLHTQALTELESLSKTLKASSRNTDAERLMAAVKEKTIRDLVVKMVYQGEADLDLKVREPNGSICSCLNRQTIGGGTLLGDALGEKTETYIAVEAFTGEYKITVERVWGKPLGDKANLVIIHHQGTPQEVVRNVTVDLKKDNVVYVKLEDGRRNTFAIVPPSSANEAPAAGTAKSGNDDVLLKLRGLADPEVVGMSGITGGAASAMATVGNDMGRTERPGERTTYQTRVSPIVNNTADMALQATISADRRYVQLSMSAYFNTLSRTVQDANVSSPLLPGGGRR